MKLANFWMKHSKGNGEFYWGLTVNRPDWLMKAVLDAHDGALPQNWIYSECQAACEAIDEGDLEVIDDLQGYAETRKDIDSHDLWQWGLDMHRTPLFTDAEDNASGYYEPSKTPTGSHITDHIQIIQVCAIEQVAGVILNAWYVHLANEEDSNA